MEGQVQLLDECARLQECDLLEWTHPLVKMLAIMRRSLPLCPLRGWQAC